MAKPTRDDRLDDEELDRALSVDADDLQSEFVQYPATLSRFGRLLARAKAEYEAAEMKMIRVAAAMRREIRAGNGERTRGPGYVTADDARDAALVSAEVQRAQDQYLEKLEAYEAMKDAVWAPLLAKKDMLVGLGASDRRVRAPEPTIREKAR